MYGKLSSPARAQPPPSEYSPPEFTTTLNNIGTAGFITLPAGIELASSEVEPAVGPAVITSVRRVCVRGTIPMRISNTWRPLTAVTREA